MLCLAFGKLQHQPCALTTLVMCATLAALECCSQGLCAPAMCIICASVLSCPAKHLCAFAPCCMRNSNSSAPAKQQGVDCLGLHTCLCASHNGAFSSHSRQALEIEDCVDSQRRMFPSALLLAYANWRFCRALLLYIACVSLGLFYWNSCSRALAPHHLICCRFARIWSVCRAGVLRCVNYHLDSLSGVLSVGVWGECSLNLLIVGAVNEAVHSQSKRKCNSCCTHGLLGLATKL